MLNHRSIAQRVINEFGDGPGQINIRAKVGGKDSETARLVREIVKQIVFALQAEAEVNTIVTTTGSPNNHTGFGKGKIT